MTSSPRSSRDEEPGDPQGAPSLAGELGRHAGHGLTLAAATVLFAWIGSQVDQRLGTEPIFVVLGAFVGFGTGFYSMYRQLVRPGDPADGPADRSAEDGEGHGEAP